MSPLFPYLCFLSGGAYCFASYALLTRRWDCGIRVHPVALIATLVAFIVERVIPDSPSILAALVFAGCVFVASQIVRTPHRPAPAQLLWRMLALVPLLAILLIVTAGFFNTRDGDQLRAAASWLLTVPGICVVLYAGLRRTRILT